MGISSWKAPATAVVALLAPLAAAILVAPNSPCSQDCGNVLTSTSGSDLTCGSGAYAGSTGQVFESCVNCELGSTYSFDNQTDTGAALYNLRATLSWCVFGFPDNPLVNNNPCVTPFACGNLTDAFEYNKTTGSAYGYCSSWDEGVVTDCSACLSALSNGQYLQNFLTVLEAGCKQEPVAGVKLGISGNVFSSQAVTITSPSLGGTASTPDYGSISLGARVGIAFGSLAFVIVIAGFCVVCTGKRRRRRLLRELGKRNGQGPPGWSGFYPRQDNNSRGGGGGGHQDMFETPLSQKPLRGWENESPVSAQTEDPQHFSPYSSQFTSPVSASEGPIGGAAADGVVWPSPPPPAFPQWPSPLQEKASIAQLCHHQESAAAARPREPTPPPVSPVGVAFGGSEHSLCSRVSDMIVGGGERAGEATDGPSPISIKGRQRQQPNDMYELREVQDPTSGGGRDPRPWMNEAAAHVPVLNHPGYGRKNGSGESVQGRDGLF